MGKRMNLRLGVRRSDAKIARMNAARVERGALVEAEIDEVNRRFEAFFEGMQWTAEQLAFFEAKQTRH